jgi:uncharacterized protein (DUF697 family)
LLKDYSAIIPKSLRRLLTPQLTDEELRETFARLRRGVPAPVVWLFGKVQTGKTSIIRGLTGAERAQIGSGFAPCTRWASRYDFPDPEFPVVTFLDTRGVGEAGYDPHDDLIAFREEAHMLLVVVKAQDMALAGLLHALTTIVREKPSWPIIVAQTTLHEGYPPEMSEHPVPYPFAQSPFPLSVPVDVARALSFQRTLFADIPVRRFVPLDFTLPEDGWSDPFYGREALLEALEEAYPHAVYETFRQLPALTRELKDLHFRRAQPYILAYAAAASAIAATPLPVTDLPVLSALQLKLLHTIAALYRQTLDKKTLLEVAGTLGISMLFRQGLRSLLKVIPGFGSVVSSAYAGATTYALGCALCFYYQEVFDGHVPRPEQLKAFYQEKFTEGTKAFRKEEAR